jgi:prevent-host-death family protein
MWSVQEAKSRLSEILRRARAGETQVIGTRDSCLVISEAQFEKARQERHLGRFLLDSAPRGEELELPSRKSRRGNPLG